MKREGKTMTDSQAQTDRIAEIKQELKRKAIIFKTGGKRSTKEIHESWIGRVGFCLPGEAVPDDADGKPMDPLAMIFLEPLPFVPQALSGVKMLAIYLSDSILNHREDNAFDEYYAIREYARLDGLIPCDNVSSYIKPFPLFPELKEDDYPVWDGGGIPEALGDEILRLEEDAGIEYFDDIVENNYSCHKVGGWPCFCQSGVWFGDDDAFVLQISSDEKAQLNIVDSGNFYFFRNEKTGTWKLHCDFY
jgi:uncharacterized protein YwqG